MRRRRPRFYIASLGCAKNTVDAEGIATLLRRAGYLATGDPARADVVIVNTCGFIAAAREESLTTLRSLAEQITPRQKLIAAGCWAQREPERLRQLLPDLDAIVGTRTWHEIPRIVQELSRTEAPIVNVQRRKVVMPEEAGTGGYVRFGASAFLKIADGCSRGCAFCAIPGIKGPTVSRPLEAILEDARQLRDAGVLEINLIAQDTSFYGHDLGMRDGLATLLEGLVEAVPDLPWLRILYLFPGFITDRLIDVIAAYPQVLPYVDIPLQHADPAILRRMRRPADVEAVKRTIGRLRERMPEITLRTTFIVGFPGESEREFLTLLRFVETMRFDRVGVFEYSHEEGTAAASLKDDVPPEVKAARRDALMMAQQRISLEKNKALVGSRLAVLLEGSSDGLTIGRTYRDAPEIDGLVLIEGEHGSGRLVEVEITAALPYDLQGRLVA